MTRGAVAGRLLAAVATLALAACAGVEQAPPKLTDAELSAVVADVLEAVEAVDGVAEAEAWYRYSGPTDGLTLRVTVVGEQGTEDCQALAEEAGRAVVETVARLSENPSMSLGAELPAEGDEPAVECAASWSPATLNKAAKHYDVSRG